jgi:putative ABC transport system permease protein
MYFHYDYLNEQLKKTARTRADFAGVFVVGIDEGPSAPDISRAIDAQFKNSLAETLTETEKAFTLSFVAMVETIVTAIEGVSYVVILIIMAVAANTMAMTARERLSEYATLKALGFKPGKVAAMIMGEAFLLALVGAGIGMLLTPIVVQMFHALTISVFAKMPLVAHTFYLQAACAVVVGLAAGVVPAYRAASVKIVDGLRHIG